MSQQSRVTIIAELQDKLTGPARKIKASAEDIGRSVEDAGKRSEQAHAGAAKAADKQAADTRKASTKIDQSMADVAKATSKMDRALAQTGIRWDAELTGIARETDRSGDKIDRALARAGVQGGQRMLGNLKSAGTRFVQEAEQIGNKAGDRIAQGIQSGIDALDTSGLAAGGGALGAGAGVLGALERDRMVRRAAAAGGTDPAALEALASSAYGAGLGDDYESVLATTTSLMAVVDLEPGSPEAERLLKGQQSITDAYGVDPGMLSLVVGVSMEVDGRTAREVQDTITAALEATAPGARDELVEAMHEYVPRLAGTGMTAEMLAAVLADSSDMGTYAVDKTGDSFAEAAGRISTGDDAALGALEAAGLNPADIRGRLLAGDATAWSDINNGLLDIEDPAARAQTAMELYGSPMEELGPGQIDDYLEAWSKMEALDSEGATNELMGALTSGEGADATKMMRALSGAFIDIGNAVAPILTPVFNLIALLAKPIAVVATGAGVLGILKRIPGFGKQGAGAVKGLSGAFSGLGGVLRAHPLMALAGIVYAGVEAFGWLYDNVDAVRRVTDGLISVFDTVDQKIRDIGQSIEDLIRDKIPGLNGAMDTMETNMAAADQGAVQGAIDKTPVGGNPFITYVMDKTGVGDFLDEHLPWRGDDKSTGGGFNPQGGEIPAHANGGFTRGDGIYRAGERGREFIVPASATNALESSAPGALASIGAGQLPGAAPVFNMAFHVGAGADPKAARSMFAEFRSYMEAWNREQGHDYGNMRRPGGRP